MVLIRPSNVSYRPKRCVRSRRSREALVWTVRPNPSSCPARRACGHRARALVALHREPGEDWTLDRMASIAGMSRSAFAMAFKQATGTTPAQYLSDWRLTLAASMLHAGKPAKLTAAELGFATQASLSKAFRLRMEVSPRKWLAQVMDAERLQRLRRYE
ncbi:helix-turn-helix transcriptional regulator [Achromobacter spanius]|uniref:helix-turn-helix transcriptional regulator n=1 Tax=Achromobacter spanius TaxID=217203 RepID=UPI003820DEF0